MARYEREMQASPYDIRLALDEFRSALRDGSSLSDLIDVATKYTNAEIRSALGSELAKHTADPELKHAIQSKLSAQ
jgi:hypothetical protein